MRGGWAKAGSTLAVLAASEEARGICLGSSARGVWLQWERLVGRPVLGKEQQAARALGPPAPAACGEGLRGPPPGANLPAHLSQKSRRFGWEASLP